MPGAGRGRILAGVVLGTALLAAAAGIALSRLVANGEYERVDARLSAELAGAVQAVEVLGRDARARAVRTAARPAVQRALARGDTAALTALAASSPNVAFERGDRRIAGPRGPVALEFPAAVVSRGVELGSVVALVPIAAVQARTALADGDRLVLVGERASRTMELDGQRYRALATEGGPSRLAAAAPLAPIEAAVAERRRRVLWALLASLAATAFLAVLLARSTRRGVRPLRRVSDEPPPGKRSSEAATLVGNALAAGHDVDSLLPVILESAVAVTGAVGARLEADGEELARAGFVGRAGPPLRLALSAGPDTSARLVLYPPKGGDFDDESVELAEWLAGRASVALQNAHLHLLARRLASTDELTQLANRRHFDEALGAEVVRAGRFDDPVAVIVADLDDFKRVNDRFGHDVGDVVLRAFADVIRANVRDVDLPARYGGEEFTVLLPGTDTEGGRRLAERLRVAAEALAVEAGGRTGVRVTSSFGVAGFPDEPSAGALLRAADRALYRAKAAGKNAVAVGSRSRRPADPPGAVRHSG